MKALWIVATVFTCSLLTSGGTNINPDNLKVVTRDDWIEISEQTSFCQVITLAKISQEVGVDPGVYRAERESSDGVFYRGPGRSVWVHDGCGGPAHGFLQGGLFIPNDLKRGIMIYHYKERPSTPATVPAELPATTAAAATAQGVAPLSAGVGSAVGFGLVTAIAESEIGNIQSWGNTNDPQFIERVMRGLHKASGPAISPMPERRIGQ